MICVRITLLIIVFCCSTLADCKPVSQDEEHRISKRSTSADHKITDLKSRFNAKATRQLVLHKILRSVDTSSSPLPMEIQNSLEKEEGGIKSSKKVRGNRRRNGRRGRKSGRKELRRQQNKLRKSVEVLLSSEYADNILAAIARVLPNDASDVFTTVKVAAGKVRQATSECACSKGK